MILYNLFVFKDQTYLIISLWTIYKTSPSVNTLFKILGKNWEKSKPNIETYPSPYTTFVDVSTSKAREFSICRNPNVMDVDTKWRMSRSTYYNYKSRIKRSVKIPGDECKTRFRRVCVRDSHTNSRPFVRESYASSRHLTRVIKPLRRAMGQCWITIRAFEELWIKGWLPLLRRISGGGEIKRSRDKIRLIKLNDESSFSISKFLSVLSDLWT